MGSWCVAENRWNLGCAGGERGVQRRGKTHARKIQSWKMQIGPVQCCAYGRSLPSLSYILVEDENTRPRNTV